MKKEMGVLSAVFPMPVLIVAAYDENETVQAMNAAWGNQCQEDAVALFIDKDHATTKAIRKTKAFSVSLADLPNIEAADYFGIVSGNSVPEKFALSGLRAEKSRFVNAPVIAEFPVTMECELAEIVETPHMYAVVGTIKNVSAEESVLGSGGKIDPGKLRALIFDPFGHAYYETGPLAGKAWGSGKEMAKAVHEKSRKIV